MAYMELATICTAPPNLFAIYATDDEERPGVRFDAYPVVALGNFVDRDRDPNGAPDQWINGFIVNPGDGRDFEMVESGSYWGFLGYCHGEPDAEVWTKRAQDFIEAERFKKR